ncbi:hypothetical protein [Desulfosporosinus sp.]|nr:hypothetical protein [Desulfosporosinus sp.]MCO5384648.1 hypothetical protein [Desulfosporosinus sp.]
MIAFILELIIAVAVSYWAWNSFGWWAGVLAFVLLMGITNSALSRER